MLNSIPISVEELEYIRNIQMVFILGKGRSGTSLLQNLLDAHPAIVGGPESKFAVVFYPRFAHIKKWKESDIIDFIELLYIEPLFSTLWHIDKKELTKAFLSVAEYANYALLCKMVYYQLRRGKENLLYISDKNPEYVLYVDTILKIFPNAKFIHIVREPRDNIYSQLTSFKEKNTIFRANQWLRYNEIIEERKKKEPGRYLTVLYEKLVGNTEATMKLVCEYLQVPFVNGMVQNQSPEWLTSHQERVGVTDKENTIHRNLLKPINTSNVGKWKNKMNPYDQAVTEIITGDFAKKNYGYEIDSKQSDKSIKVSSLSLLKGKFIYNTWQKFTQFKTSSLRFNLFYSRLKRAIYKNTPIWEHF
jgi:protein-tyrosine sulfotransferase